ncbi:hypothetical protein [Paraburkholderia lycopersici]|uniref:Uncharacterized protein n=1 Tax=Paraburkholderia lycopersici TaxID=416944 RepID=A0A1G6KVC3_9BURK|nr:hypothetical protein [Paraburkholderia lycopersici]SDC35049.1 hypothetical protein SAMN05421548_1066 [Paraburkholderia lycopersici]
MTKVSRPVISNMIASLSKFGGHIQKALRYFLDPASGELFEADTSQIADLVKLDCLVWLSLETANAPFAEETERVDHLVLHAT